MEKVFEKGIETNMGFWKFIKPFLTNEGTTSGNDIALNNDKNMIRNEYEIANNFNEHYYNNIVKKSSGYKPINIESSFDLRGLKDEKLIVEKITQAWWTHPTIMEIKKKFSFDLKVFNFQQIKISGIKLLKQTTIQKSYWRRYNPSEADKTKYQNYSKTFKINYKLFLEPRRFSRQSQNCHCSFTWLR